MLLRQQLKQPKTQQMKLLQRKSKHNLPLSRWLLTTRIMLPLSTYRILYRILHRNLNLMSTRLILMVMARAMYRLLTMIRRESLRCM